MVFILAVLVLVSGLNEHFHWYVITNNDLEIEIAASLMMLWYKQNSVAFKTHKAMKTLIDAVEAMSNSLGFFEKAAKDSMSRR